MTSSILMECSAEERLAILGEYGKSPAVVLEDIGKIKEWIRKQPHLPEIPEDDVIERMLLLNKFRVEQAKEKLDLYYSVRTLIPEFYDKTPSDLDLLRAMDIVYFIPLPKLTKDLNRVLLTKVREPNVEDFDALFYVIHTLHVTEIRLKEDYMLSQIVVYDMANVKINHLTSFGPSLIKKGTFIIEKVFSARVRAIHFVNVTSFMESFVSVVKSVLKPKLANRLFLHKDYDSVFKMVPREVMPVDLGGKERSLEEIHGMWKKKFLEYQDMFDQVRQVRVNEEMRPEKLPYDDYFGMEGNFRKLEVD